MASIVGPTIAALHAAGVCAESLAEHAGLSQDEIDAATHAAAARTSKEITTESAIAFATLEALHQHVVDDLVALATLAVSGAVSS